ncbi:hypothetical protein W97_05794 [Coniosporium apollinis CBS 100218]|uniref:Cyanovirin-N domain-containing protein n=1 Tax=Coniosporium apollinis (strain CBS 100218) TaxID=1168221 RepID=R7YXM2_CONA1|nr:uncharacterized protein W97_05794 [Coniosporium apollinis CBS 100218]EON66549.1 hypothetical protein W97_05794 [Coniosporium apollinis CBS 100218]
MQLNIILFAAVLAVAASAAPAPPCPECALPPKKGVSKKIPVKMCTEPMLKGYCQEQTFISGECNNIMGKIDNSMSSIWTMRNCELFENPNCRGRKVNVKHPGWANFHGFDNMVSSLRCF